MKPLSQVKVVDFTQFLAGPYCTMQLADFGADVVKVEKLRGGDDARMMGPMVEGVSYPFNLPNRNKRSLAIDLKTEESKEIIRRLVATADVVVENFRPGVADRLGFGYEEVRKANPELIYCSISGFGQTGPISQRPGFDIIAQGMAGFLSMTGPVGGEPAKFGVAVTDLVAGMNAAMAVMAAYIRRLREGGGQYIDVSLLDSGLALTVWEGGAWFGAGVDAEPNGSRHRGNAPYQALPTKDGYVTVGANNNRLWERLCMQVMNRPDIYERAEYKSSSERIARVDQLEAELIPIFKERTTEEWVQLLDVAGVPGGPVLTYAEALEQPQAVARNMVVELPHPRLGAVKVLGPAVKMSETPPEVVTAAPLLGEHSIRILQSLGYSSGQADMFVRGGVIMQSPKT